MYDTSSKTEQIKQLIISHRTAVEVSLMWLILVIAITLRVLPSRWGEYLNEYDPFYWNRAAEYIAENGLSAWMTWHDTLSWYPMGNDAAHFYLVGNSFSAAIIYWMLNGMGLRVSVHTISLYFPVFMACCTCVAVYYLAKDLGGKNTGLFSALFVAINPSYISRTNFGFFDTENIAIFGIVATALFFLRSIEQDKTLKKRIVYATLSGFALGYALASWGASRYIVGLLGLFGVASLLLGRSSWRLITSLAITSIIGLLMAAFVPALGFKFLLNIDNLAILGLLGVLVVHELLKTKIDEKRSRLVVVGLVLLGFASIIVLPMVGVGFPIKDKFARVINPFQSTSPLFASIGENRMASWSTFYNNFGITLLLTALGVYHLLKRRDDRAILVAILFLTSLYFTVSLLRLIIVFSIPESIMAAYGLSYLITLLTATEEHTHTRSELSGTRRKRGKPAYSAYARERGEKKAYSMGRSLKIVLITLLSLSSVPHILYVAALSQSPGLLAMSGVPLKINGEYASDWPDALNWMKANTAPDSIICSWWDYGYWIQGVAERTTLVDGSTRNATQIRNVAKMMLKPPNESLAILKSYDVSYIVVFHTYNSTNPSEEWPFGDNAVWPHMADIAGIDPLDFYDIDLSTGEISYSAAFTNSTIYRLMYEKTNIPHLELAYESGNGWVLVYKVEY